MHNISLLLLSSRKSPANKRVNSREIAFLTHHATTSAITIIGKYYRSNFLKHFPPHYYYRPSSKLLTTSITRKALAEKTGWKVCCGVTCLPFYLLLLHLSFSDVHQRRLHYIGLCRCNLDLKNSF